jgi:hypothetical protein
MISQNTRSLGEQGVLAWHIRAPRAQGGNLALRPFAASARSSHPRRLFTVIAIPRSWYQFYRELIPLHIRSRAGLEEMAY